jgi:hypothetical protein
MSQKKKTKTVDHPTMFVHEGTIKCYEEGTMLELKTLLSQEEWLGIVKETVEYLIFITCLKTVAFPILNEAWDKDDDWWRVQLEIAVNRMRDLDPLVLIPIDQDAIRTAFTDKMKANAASVVEDIKAMRQARITHSDVTQVSEL